MMTEGRVRAIAAQVAAAIAAKIKPSVSEEQIRSDVEAVIRQMQENGELTGSDLTDEQIAAVQENAEAAAGSATAAQAAQGKAETAQAAAESAKATATQKATEATNAAQTAAGKATEASQSATAAGTAKTAAEEAAARAEEAANRLLGVAVVGEIETADGQTNIVLTGDLAPGAYTFAYLVRKADGTTETATIGTYTVEDESTTKTYTVTWVVDSKTTTETYKEGDTPIFKGSTDKAADDEYTYTFAGWSPEIESVKADATYTATYTQTAKPVEPSYTNLADPSNAYWKDGYRLSISGGDSKECAGRVVTNFIPAKTGNDLYVKGLDITKTVNSQQSKIVKYTSASESAVSGGAYGVATVNADCYGNKVVTIGDVQKITLLEVNDGTNTMTDNIKYIRLDGVLMDGYTSSDVIITINEPIE